MDEELQEAADAPLPDPDGDDGPEDGGTDPDAAEGDTAPDEPYVVRAPEGRILEAGDALVFDGEKTHYGMVIPNEDVYRKVFPRGCKRPTYVQLVHKGVPMPTTMVQSLSF